VLGLAPTTPTWEGAVKPPALLVHGIVLAFLVVAVPWASAQPPTGSAAPKPGPGSATGGEHRLGRECGRLPLR
jgi:hypothetical protein